MFDHLLDRGTKDTIELLGALIAVITAIVAITRAFLKALVDMLFFPTMRWSLRQAKIRLRQIIRDLESLNNLYSDPVWLSAKCAEGVFTAISAATKMAVSGIGFWFVYSEGLGDTYYVNRLSSIAFVLLTCFGVLQFAAVRSFFQRVGRPISSSKKRLALADRLIKTVYKPDEELSQLRQRISNYVTLGAWRRLEPGYDQATAVKTLSGGVEPPTG